MNSSFFLGSVAAAIGFFTLFRKFRFQQDNKDSKSSSIYPPSSSLSPTSPPSSSLSRIWKHSYDVFPSFHGADVRRTILSHILDVFRRKGIDSFIDNDIKRGTSIDPELIEAIRGSKIKIVLLSKNYASSSWCLDELAEIMNCREELSQIVMTIFYEVDPTDIRKQTRDFGKAFRKTCKGRTKGHIVRWRKALEDVAKIAGEHSCNWVNEAAMIEKIATDVSNMLTNSTPSRDFDDLVGMEAHMKRMEHMLLLDSDEVRMIGIWGPPGIGKTTIARVLFNQVSSSFQLSTIMGVAQEWLRDKKVFLVLDEVDHLRQLHALAKEIQWFGPGSRIIITTEDERVLKAHGIKHIYKVDFQSSVEAFQIFCMHAFEQKHPYDGFNELAREVTNLAGKLPLGLKVLGSALRGMSKKEWERRLPRLKTRLDGEIESIIKFSYDALEDEEKYLFLYIACLYSFRVPRKVEELLAKHVEGVRQSLDILAEKSLISINKFGRIDMHSLLIQFGRKTSREQFVHGRVKHQLLVGEIDICEVLDRPENRRFIGFDLDLSKIEEELNISEKAIERMSDLQFISIHGDGVANSERLQSLLYYSQNIRSLHWENFQYICLPSTFNSEFLVELVMPDSKLQMLWEGTKPLRNLKSMDLRYSGDLKELPDLSTASNLEELILINCSSLVELPSTLGKLTSLQFRGCSSLVELPSSIMNTTNLEELDLMGCSSLVKLPSSIENVTNLKKLRLSHCSSLVELPSIGNATNLKELDLSYCSNLVELPLSLGNATNLQKLDLRNCSSLVKFPSSIENATNLKILYLPECSSLVELPSIGNATKLRELSLDNCSSLVKLPSSINGSNLHYLFLENCSRVVELSAIENATNLEILKLNNCSSLVEIPPSIGTATKLRKLNLSGCSSLVKFPSSIGDMTNLEEMDLSNCSSLLELPPFIGTATNLWKLDISGCSSLVKLPSSIGDITNLKRLTLSNCSSLVELPSSIGNLKLYELRMCGCSKIEALPTNINLESLDTLDLTDCSQLKRFPEISTNINFLKIIGTAIKEVPLSIMSWSRLYNLEMSYFESLNEFPQVHDTITHLHLNEDVQEIAQWVKGMSSLCKLILNNCNKLVSLPQFSDSLSYIDADNCKSLERLDCSFNNPEIFLKFTNCFKLNQEARDLIMHTSTRNYAVLPGTQVPACFDYRATGGGSLTIKLNERNLSTSLKFKACIILGKSKEETCDDERAMSIDIDIMDKQNDLPVMCTPTWNYIKPLLTDHIYTFEVEVTDVTSTKLVIELKPHNSKWKIGECGLLQILEDPSC